MLLLCCRSLELHNLSRHHIQHPASSAALHPHENSRHAWHIHDETSKAGVNSPLSLAPLSPRIQSPQPPSSQVVVGTSAPASSRNNNNSSSGNMTTIYHENRGNERSIRTSASIQPIVDENITRTGLQGRVQKMLATSYRTPWPLQ